MVGGACENVERADGQAAIGKIPAEIDAAPGMLDGAVDALRAQIMADIEARLDSTTHSLWRRGQAEITKLQQERKEVISYINELQTRQEALVAENQGMRTALMQMTEKLEFVALEMREVIRSLPTRHEMQRAAVGQPQKGLLASGTGEPLPEPTPGSPVTSTWAEAAPCTPPRPTDAAVWGAQMGSSPAPWSSAQKPAPAAEPAVRLSLATALPSVAAAPQSAPPAGQPSKTLQIAECLGREVVSMELAKEAEAEGLGMDVAVADGFSLSVGAVVEGGPVARHNAQQESAATMVLVGDRIVEVNGIARSSIQMLEECRAKPRLALKLVREPTAPAQEPWAGAEGATTPVGASTLQSSWNAAPPLTPGGLRAEAPAFVPSAHKESAPVQPPTAPPPGLPSGHMLEGLACDPLVVLTGGAGAGAGESRGIPETKVNRALFA